MPWITHSRAFINAILADRALLTMENVALRQQLVEAFQGERDMPECLHLDRDSIYGPMFERMLGVIRVTEVVGRGTHLGIRAGQTGFQSRPRDSR